MFCCIKYIPCVYVQKNEASMKYHCVIEEMRLEEQQKQQKEDAEKSLEAELQLHKVIQKFGLIMQLLFICLFCIKLTQLLSTIFAGCICGVPQWISTFSKHDQRRSWGWHSTVCDRSSSSASHISLYFFFLLSVLLTYDFAKISLDLTLTFEEQMVELCMQLFQTGLAEHQQREAEVNLFLSAQTQAVTEYQQKASQTLMEFESKHKKVSLDKHTLSIHSICYSWFKTLFPHTFYRIYRSYSKYQTLTHCRSRSAATVMKLISCVTPSCQWSFSWSVSWRYVCVFGPGIKG